MRLLLLTTILSTLAHLSAAPSIATNYLEAATQAKSKNIPFAVYVHGSSWHRASQTFGKKIWQSPDFHKALKNPVILTHIHIKQHLDKETAKKETSAYKGWNAKTVHSFPAIQIYGPDGHLLHTYLGKEFRILTDPESLARHIDQIIKLSSRRTTLLSQITEARNQKDTQKEITLLTSLIELPLKNEARIINQLKKVDPKDTSGWQARLSFRNWEFVRQITGLINNKKAHEALTKVNAMLDSKKYTTAQQCLILGAKGKTLVALGKLPEAWDTFQQAYQTDPKSPDAKAMLRHGIRIAGIPLREIVPTNSILFAKNPGANLTRDHATFTMSSISSDDKKNHASLFKGPHARNGYAFHTDKEKGAHIIIDLQTNCTVRALRITNRHKIHSRAASLTLWTSTDQKNWTQVWSAQKPAPAWDILLTTPKNARYLKLGLNPKVTDYLHLRAVDVYGQRP